MLHAIHLLTRSAQTALLALWAAVLSLGGCDRRPEPAPQPSVATAAPQPPAGSAPRPPPVVDRVELLAAINAVRSAYAEGEKDANPSLAGRQFMIRQAFGCTEPDPRSPGDPTVAGTAQWTFGKDHKTIEIRLSPSDWRTSPLLAVDPGWEAAEGYWLTRPWLQTESCPAPALGNDTPLASPDVAPALGRPKPAPTPQNAGLVALFGKDSSRVGRRDSKPFTVTLRSDTPLVAPADGYRLVIEGRFVTFPDGQAIRCSAASLDQSPICAAAAEIDRVAFEDAEGKLLKEWRQG